MFSPAEDGPRPPQLEVRQSTFNQPYTKINTSAKKSIIVVPHHALLSRLPPQEMPPCFFYTESLLFWVISLGLGCAIPSLAVLFEILGFTMVSMQVYIGFPDPKCRIYRLEVGLST